MLPCTASEQNDGPCNRHSWRPDNNRRKRLSCVTSRSKMAANFGKLLLLISVLYSRFCHGYWSTTPLCRHTSTFPYLPLCPAGAVISGISLASYGNSSLSCVSPYLFTPGLCQATNNILEAISIACLNKQTCNINMAMISDPVCPGVSASSKRLSMVGLCAYGTSCKIIF